MSTITNTLTERDREAIRCTAAKVGVAALAHAYVLATVAGGAAARKLSKDLVDAMVAAHLEGGGHWNRSDVTRIARGAAALIGRYGFKSRKAFVDHCVDHAYTVGTLRELAPLAGAPTDIARKAWDAIDRAGGGQRAVRDAIGSSIGRKAARGATAKALKAKDAKATKATKAKVEPKVEPKATKAKVEPKAKVDATNLEALTAMAALVTTIDAKTLTADECSVLTELIGVLVAMQRQAAKRLQVEAKAKA